MIIFVKNKIIKKNSLHIRELKDYFGTKNSFKIDDISLFYKGYEPELSIMTLNWRIHYLVQKDILERVGRGIFRIGKNRLFVPEITSQQKSIYKKVAISFPFSDFSIWNTLIINEFSQHHSAINYTLLEVEKDSLQSVFYTLKNNNNTIFIEPTNEMIENYLSNVKNPIILKTLISEAPVQTVQNILVPTIEKILVDLFCDKDLFFAFQGNELRIIFQNVFSKYTINQNKMIRYANRRGRKEEFVNYITQFQTIGDK